MRAASVISEGPKIRGDLARDIAVRIERIGLSVYVMLSPGTLSDAIALEERMLACAPDGLIVDLHRDLRQVAS